MHGDRARGDPSQEHEAARAYLLALDDAISLLVARYGAIEFFRPTLAIDVPDDLSGLTLHILGQQISRFAAMAIYRRLEELLGGAIDARGLAASSDEELRRVGLSAAKARAVRELGEQVASGALDFDELRELPDDETLARLVALRGVGPWSAHVFMLRELHRPDVFPAGDIGLRRGIEMLDGLPAMPSTAHAGERALMWRPYRSYAAGYLWRSYAEAAPAKRRSSPVRRTAPAG